MRLEDYKARIDSVLERLRELGADVPAMPDTMEITFSDCRDCKKTGRRKEYKYNKETDEDEVEEFLCAACGGSGQIAHTPMIDFNRRVARLTAEYLHGKS